MGFGNMAQAIAQHLIKIPGANIFAASPSLQSGKTIEGIHTDPDNLSIIKKSHIIVLAVKPQKAVNVLKQIGPVLPSNSLLLSIVAGLNLTYLAQYCRKTQAIVRSMPNLPIQIGKGATPLIANQFVTTQQKKNIHDLFQQAGIVSWIEKESDIDRLTALSGSGPAYLFYILEAMISAGKKLGLSDELSRNFVLQTAAGAISLAERSELELHELIKKITSPAGTTAAALDIFQKERVDLILFEAINAAYQRAQQLGSSPLNEELVKKNEQSQ